MKYVKQFLIILFISFLGEILNNVLPLPIPASIYGIIILLICFLTGIVKVEKIEEVSNFLLEILPILFIPPGVAIMNSYGSIKNIIAPIMIIIFVSTIVVMIVTGRVAQFIIRRKNKKEGRKNA